MLKWTKEEDQLEICLLEQCKVLLIWWQHRQDAFTGGHDWDSEPHDGFTLVNNYIYSRKLISEN